MESGSRGKEEKCGLWIRFFWSLPCADSFALRDVHVCCCVRLADSASSDWVVVTSCPVCRGSASVVAIVDVCWFHLPQDNRLPVLMFLGCMTSDTLIFLCLRFNVKALFWCDRNKKTTTNWQVFLCQKRNDIFSFAGCRRNSQGFRCKSVLWGWNQRRLSRDRQNYAQRPSLYGQCELNESFTFTLKARVIVRCPFRAKHLVVVRYRQGRPVSQHPRPRLRTNPPQMTAGGLVQRGLGELGYSLQREIAPAVASSTTCCFKQNDIFKASWCIFCRIPWLSQPRTKSSWKQLQQVSERSAKNVWWIRRCAAPRSLRWSRNVCPSGKAGQTFSCDVRFARNSVFQLSLIIQLSLRLNVTIQCSFSIWAGGTQRSERVDHLRLHSLPGQCGLTSALAIIRSFCQLVWVYVAWNKDSMCKNVLSSTLYSSSTGYRLSGCHISSIPFWRWGR